MKKHLNGRNRFFSACLLGLGLLLVVTSCTKNDETECPECESIIIEDIINPFQGNGTSNSDSTNIIIEDIINP